MLFCDVCMYHLLLVLADCIQVFGSWLGIEKCRIQVPLRFSSQSCPSHLATRTLYSISSYIDRVNINPYMVGTGQEGTRFGARHS